MMSFLIQESDAYVPIMITSKCNDKRLNFKVEYIYQNMVRAFVAGVANVPNVKYLAHLPHQT